jgi:tRNA threonylcarbamoyladenosine biosynthesis protein TsaE
MKEHFDFETEFGLGDLETMTQTLLQKFGKYQVWLLEGILGAGKTTFVQQLAKHLGIEGEILSPTFSIVNQYSSAKKGTVCHLDLYRLKNISEAFEIGLFEMEERGYFCLIEWASAVGYRPSVPYVEITIEHLQLTKRRLRLRIHEN